MRSLTSKNRTRKLKSKKNALKVRVSHLNLPVGLKKGDSLALIRPATKIDKDKWEASIRDLRAAGYFVLVYPGSFREDTYFSASDDERAKEFDWAMREPAAKAVLCCRAGYGSMRMIARIRSSQIKKWRPKIIMGYSDITYLHAWIHNQLKWPSFHGPLMGFLNAIEISQSLGNLMDLAGKKREELWAEVEILNEGEASGNLYGGNLSLIQADGPAALPRRPMILAVEDVNEDWYRLDRMVWSLIQSGYGEYVKGIIVGTLEGCGKKDSENFGVKKFQESLKALSSGPIWWGGNFGHGLKVQRILALGLRVKMTKEKILHYLEPAVR
ncbi:MAG: hypothetical protein COV44_03695 [Deltaproteobacteria bacterium CG11_big_fil_rev_8_21_14_0_20_45_16]|nr:MAG: hypothetical protein COV44_03695 [Deltaproteobacteria bacterium CG11_big_fil_rev_8_21_14_0_20_45_16]